jgi:hypothetical protein
VDPQRGTRYGTYTTNWTYGTRMPVLDICTWPRGDVPGSGLTDGDVGILRGMNYDILAQGFNRNRKD